MGNGNNLPAKKGKSEVLKNIVEDGTGRIPKKEDIMNQKEDLASSRERWKQNLKMNEGEILRETNFKELGITNKDGRDAYVIVIFCLVSSFNLIVL